MKWGRWLKRGLQHQPARALGTLVGIALLALGPQAGHAGVAATLVVGGLFLFALSAFLPFIDSLRVSTKGVEYKAKPYPRVAVGASDDAEGVSVNNPDAVLEAWRFLAASSAIEGLLRTPTDGPLASAELQLFLYDSDERKLVSAMDSEEESDPPDAWDVGQGVTGEAYGSGEYAIASGKKASDDTYGLTEEMQDRYRDLTVVAAMPVRNQSGRTIAVLAASSKENDSQLGSPDGFDEHLFRAQAVGRVLIDQLGWFSDE